MGISTSSSLPDHFSGFTTWSWERGISTIYEYIESDFEFRLDITEVVYFTKYNFKTALALVKALSQNDTGVISAHLLMATIIVLSDNAKRLLKERIEVAYDVFDLNRAQQLGLHELIILLHTFEYAAICIQGKSILSTFLPAPSGDSTWSPTLQRISKKASIIFTSLGKETNQTISKDEFVQWALESFHSQPEVLNFSKFQRWITTENAIPKPRRNSDSKSGEVTGMKRNKEDRSVEAVLDSPTRRRSSIRPPSTRSDNDSSVRRKNSILHQKGSTSGNIDDSSRENNNNNSSKTSVDSSVTVNVDRKVHMFTGLHDATPPPPAASESSTKENIQADDEIFATVDIEKDRRASRRSSALYEALNNGGLFLFSGMFSESSNDISSSDPSFKGTIDGQRLNGQEGVNEGDDDGNLDLKMGAYIESRPRTAPKQIDMDLRPRSMQKNGRAPSQKELVDELKSDFFREPSLERGLSSRHGERVRAGSSHSSKFPGESTEAVSEVVVEGGKDGVDAASKEPNQSQDTNVEAPVKAKEDAVEDNFLNSREHKLHFPPYTEQHTSITAVLLKDEPKLYHVLRKISNTGSQLSIDQLIQASVDVPDISVGCVLGDESCYERFAELYDPIINCLHNHLPETIHKSDLDPSHVTFPDLDTKYIRSCSIRCHRNISGFPFSSFVSRAQRRAVCRIIMDILETFDTNDELYGQYFPVDTDDSTVEKRFIFGKPTAEFCKTGAFDCGYDWPDSRRVYYNRSKQIILWINDEDHLRVISIEKGHNLKIAFSRWCTVCTLIERKLNLMGYKFAYSNHLGYLTGCPTKVGTAMRFGVSVKLPHLSKHEQIFGPLCMQLGLTYQAPTDSKGWCDISNSLKLGASETELVQSVVDGIHTLIRMEKAVENKDKDGYQAILSSLSEDFIPPSIPSVFIPNAAFRDISDEEYSKKIQLLVDKTDDFPLFTPSHTSLLAKFLTPKLYNSLRFKTTINNVTLQDVIFHGVEHPTSEIGVVAGDAESFDTFLPLFQPIIRSIHKTSAFDSAAWKAQGLPFQYSLENPDSIPAFAEKIEQKILSCRVELHRNIAGYPFPSQLTRGQRKDLHNILGLTAEEYTDALYGTFQPMVDIIQQPDLEALLLENGLLFQKPDPAYYVHGKDWPDGRGIYANRTMDLLIWVNDENHLTFISLNQGCDLPATFLHGVYAVRKFEELLSNRNKCFAYSNSFGYLTSSLSNLGLGITFKVTVAIDHLDTESKNEQVMKLCESLGLKMKLITRMEEVLHVEVSQRALLGLSDTESTDNFEGSVLRFIEGCEILCNRGSK